MAVVRFDTRMRMAAPPNPFYPLDPRTTKPDSNSGLGTPEPFSSMALAVPWSVLQMPLRFSGVTRLWPALTVLVAAACGSDPAAPVGQVL